jgi:hypothetical protein
MDNHLQTRTDDQIEMMICFLLHLAITLRVQIFKFKKNHNQATQISTITQMNFQNTEKVTLADFVTSSVLAIWIGSLAVLQNKIRNIAVDEISSLYYSFFLFGSLYFVNSFSALVFSGVYIFRHSRLRKKLKVELTSAIQNIPCNH